MAATLFILLLSSILSGVFLHIVFLRMTKGKLSTLGSLAALSLTSIMALYFSSMNAVNIFVFIVFIISFYITYTLILIGVLNESPTLAIAKLLQSHPEGVDQTSLDNFIAKQNFIVPRLAALFNSGDIGQEGNSLILKPKAVFYLKIMTIYLRLIQTEGVKG